MEQHKFVPVNVNVNMNINSHSPLTLWCCKEAAE